MVGTRPGLGELTIGRGRRGATPDDRSRGQHALAFRPAGPSVPRPQAVAMPARPWAVATDADADTDADTDADARAAGSPAAPRPRRVGDLRGDGHHHRDDHHDDRADHG